MESFHFTTHQMSNRIELNQMAAEEVGNNGIIDLNVGGESAAECGDHQVTHLLGRIEE